MIRTLRTNQIGIDRGKFIETLNVFGVSHK